MKILVLALLALLGLLQYKLWFGTGSITGAWQLRNQIAMLQGQNTEWQAKNAVLAADVQDLKTGNEAIEERARSELGMVKQDEVFYQVVQ